MQNELALKMLLLVVNLILILSGNFSISRKRKNIYALEGLYKIRTKYVYEMKFHVISLI